MVLLYSYKYNVIRKFCSVYEIGGSTAIFFLIHWKNGVVSCGVTYFFFDQGVGLAIHL